MKKNVLKIFSIAVIVLLTACAPQKTEESSVDVDLTVMSGTMVYSQVYDIVTNSQRYLGKIIKMRGQFSVYTDESTGVNYYACMITDATACCAQGIEFTLEGDYSYPEDYPAMGEEITVTGEFETYEENGIMYSRLKNAVMR